MKKQRILTLAAYYDATSTTSERDWGYGSSVPTSEDWQFSIGQRQIAISRIRREIRNNPFLSGLVNKYPEAVGFSNLRSVTSSKEYNEKKELFWYRWSKKVTTSDDSLRTLEEIIIRELLITGECFLVLLASGRVQMIPSEYCGAFGKGGVGNNGIDYDDFGKPIRYHFGKVSKSGTLEFTSPTVVEARNVIHIYHKDRVQMGRGLPWLLPCLNPARDLAEIFRSKTKQIKDVNAISGVITKANATQLVGSLPSYNGRTEPEAISGTASANPTGDAQIELKPGQFAFLEEGEDIKTLGADYQAGDYKELIMLMLHAISSPLGLPVELWYSGLGDVNYSGFKGLGVQWNGRRKYILNLLEDRYLNRLHFWRIRKAELEGELPANPDGDDDLIDWAWRRTPVLDDDKQANANAKRLETGELIISDIWEENGYYAEEVFTNRKNLWAKLHEVAGLPVPKEVPLEFLYRGKLPSELKTEPVPPTSEPPATSEENNDDSQTNNNDE